VRREGHLLGRAIAREDWRTFVDLLLGAPSPLERNARVQSARRAYDAGDLETALRLYPLRHRTEKRALTALLRGRSPREVFETLPEGPKRIWVSAWQSYLFNRILDRRVRMGTYDRLLVGDVAWLEEHGACYPVADEALEAPRARAGLASPTGPLVGYDLRFAEGEPGRIEREILDEEGADPEAFRPSHARARGLRRPLRVALREASIEEEPDGSVIVRFVLPPGAFATVLLDALMAPPADGPGSVRMQG
jgi:tRNA pseudouridine13 synthase